MNTHYNNNGNNNEHTRDIKPILNAQDLRNLKERPFVQNQALQSS